MTRVSEEEVVRLAALARIKLEEGEAPRLASDLESILEHVAAIEAADPGAAPGKQAGDGSFRKDDAEDRVGTSSRDAFPDRDGGFLKVPRVLPSHDA